MNRDDRGRCARRRRRAVVRNRRGSVYLLVLGLAMVLTLIGVASVTAGRVGGRAMTDSEDWVESQSLAFSAAEHAMTQISRDSNWRTTYASQTVTKSLGRGTLTWHLVDEVDGNLTDDATQAFAILATGSVGRASYSVRVHMRMGSGILYGAVTTGTINVKNGSGIDSYDSSLGAYGGSNVGSAAHIATNSTGAGKVAFDSGAYVHGSVSVGPGADPYVVVTNESVVSGTLDALAQALTMPTLTAPTGMGASLGDKTYSAATTWSSNLHVNKLTIKGGHRIAVQGNVTVLAENDVLIQDKNTGFDIRAGSSLKFYFKNNFSIDKDSTGTSTIADPGVSRLQFLNLGTRPMTLEGNWTMPCVVISPNGDVHLHGGFDLCGAVIGKTLTISAGAALHQDLNITNGADPVMISSSTTPPKPDAWGRVVQ